MSAPVLAMADGGAMTPPATIGEALIAARQNLRRAGSESIGLEARLLVARGVGRAVEYLIGHAESPITPVEWSQIRALTDRRCRHEPMAYILGEREFWSLPFKVGPGVLIPRPESEILVDRAVSHLEANRNAHFVLDLGTGSGCLLIAVLATVSKAEGIGIDRSLVALKIAQANANTLDVADRCRFIASNWGASISGSVDIIVANPPYIRDDEFAGLAADIVEFEPRGALAGGPDGLDAYRRIIPDAARLLAPEGAIFMECASRQCPELAAMFRAADLQHVEVANDFSGQPRVVMARRI